MWLTKNGLGRHTSPAGYVVLSPIFISDEDMPMFMAMTTKSSKKVLEHRWNMAKFLGRALNSWECVDHMDGNKENNDPSNLRIYVRGKNDPGSANGHGTYYHELQLALKRIRELEKELSRR